MSFILAQVLPILLSLAGVEAPPSGAALYRERCSICHGPQGGGLVGVVPPLAASDYLKADARRAIRTLLKGLSGPITVNGQRYDAPMPAHDTLTDAQVAAVLTFVGASWGNELPAVTAAEVAAVRAETAREPVIVAACGCGGACVARASVGGCGGRCGMGAGAVGGCSAAGVGAGQGAEPTRPKQRMGRGR